MRADLLDWEPDGAYDAVLLDAAIDYATRTMYERAAAAAALTRLTERQQRFFIALMRHDLLHEMVDQRIFYPRGVPR